MKIAARRRPVLAALMAVLAAQPAASIAAMPQPSNGVLSDQAIRDWLTTHPEALQKIVAEALTQDSMTPTIDRLVHDSLLRQPTLMAELGAAAHARQRADQEARLRDALPKAHAALYDDPRDGRDGAVQPTAALVVFLDGECPYCRLLQPTLTRLVAEHPDVAVIYKEFPILGPVSVFAAKASLAAVAQGKYSAFHAALMASTLHEHDLKQEQVLAMAKACGLDIGRLMADMMSPEIDAKISANKALAASLGIQGTPGVLIGNQLVPGNLPYEQLLQLVQQAPRL